MGKAEESVRKNHKWESGAVEEVILPNETYGRCTRGKCKNIGELGNGVCQRCWDRGAVSGTSLPLPSWRR